MCPLLSLSLSLSCASEAECWQLTPDVAQKSSLSCHCKALKKHEEHREWRGSRKRVWNTPPCTCWLVTKIDGHSGSGTIGNCIIKSKISFANFCAAKQPYAFLFTAFSLVKLFSKTWRRYIQSARHFFSLLWGLSHFCFLRAFSAFSFDSSHSFGDWFIERLLSTRLGGLLVS